jgi:hypothetical protein
MTFFLSADPAGIGSAPEKHTSCFTGQAFHRAEEGRKKKTIVLQFLCTKMMMDINELSSRIIVAAIAVHKILGPGMLESASQGPTFDIP